MFLRKLLRTFRKSVIFGAILTLAVLYCCVSIFRQLQGDESIDENEDLTVHQVRQPFQWHSPTDEQNATEFRLITCRNSVQGKILIADDRGYACQRLEILPSGCCNIEAPTTKRYFCQTCLKNYCCSIYEHCISCCLHPEKKPLLQNVLGKASGNFNLLFASVTDHFELCLVKCRTSSQSVQHENSYRDSKHKIMTATTNKTWDAAKIRIPANPTPLYSFPWLNDCCDKLFKPGTRIEKVISSILTNLAPRVKARMSNDNSEKRRQCTYSLLGFRYVLEHFAGTNYNPETLDKLSASERQKLVEDSQASIIEDVERIQEKLGHDQQLTYYSPETPLGSFLVDSQVVFKNGVDKQLRDNKKLKIKMNARERSGRAVAFENGGELEIWESQMDVLAQALVAVCDYEPERTWTLLKPFREKQYTLPSPIRIIVMKQFLFNREKTNFGGANGIKDMEQSWRAQFLKVVHHNTSSLQMDRAIRSTLWKQIDSTVIETYGRVASLRPYDTDEHQIEAARALNILHVYSKNFEPTLILWLFPIQLTFSYAVKSTDFHVLELAMYLDLIVRHCVPSAADTFSVADEVTEIWRQWDRELLMHVINSISKNVWINQKDFPNLTIHPERSEANKLMVKLKGRSRDDIPSECLKIFTNPAIFIRKWIAEGFVGVLSTNALLFVWDQLFFNEWSTRIVRDVCLTIIFLLKARFVKAKNYFNVREIFVCDPGRLYTSDLKRAYRHIQNGSSFDDIPAMNRNTVSAAPHGSRQSKSEKGKRVPPASV